LPVDCELVSARSLLAPFMGAGAVVSWLFGGTLIAICRGSCTAADGAASTTSCGAFAISVEPGCRAGLTSVVASSCFRAAGTGVLVAAGDGMGRVAVLDSKFGTFRLRFM